MSYSYSDGDAWALPTASPSTPLPSGPPTASAALTSTLAPTVFPTYAPTSRPSSRSAPADYEVAVSMTLDGLACADYDADAAAETAFVEALAATLGHDASHFGDTACGGGSDDLITVDDHGGGGDDDARPRRSRRLTASASLSFSLRVASTDADDATASGADLADAVRASLAAAVSDGSLTSAIATAAADAGSTAMAGVEASGFFVSTLAPSPAPTMLPSLAPTASAVPTATPAPTSAPTSLPTQQPTPMPTQAPSTAAPSPSPSRVPSPAPTPMPSIPCASTEHLYRLLMFDSGGEGWEGVEFAIWNSSTHASTYEGSVVDSGTLPEGFAGTHWVCLVDGCYEIATQCDGCNARIQSEVSWE